MRRPGIAGALMIAALAPAPARAATVDAGALRATVQADPWHVTFTDARGATVLDESDALRVHTATGWARATRLTEQRMDGGTLHAVAATDDPAGTRIALTVEPMRDGSIRLTGAAAGADGAGMGFATRRGERWLGFGERMDAVVRSSGVVTNRVEDGPVIERERPFVPLIAPPWAAGQRADSTYYPVPWALSTAGYGVLIERDETSRFSLGAPTWSAEVDAPAITLRVFPGPQPADALRRFTAATGRQPAAQAPWADGPWFQTGQPNQVPPENEAAWMAALHKADAPVSAGETQMHYLPCGAQHGNEATEALRTRRFHAAGLARLVYFNPLLCVAYTDVYGPAAANHQLQENAAGQPYTYSGFVGGPQPAGFVLEPLTQFDFTRPSTVALYHRLLQEAVDAGADGWMEDFGEYTPPDAVSADGTPGAQMHNRYPRDYHCAARAFQVQPRDRPLVRFQRSGWTGAARCADVVWGGDQATEWDFDGLTSAVREAQTIGASGVSRWGSDIGGYDSLGPDIRLDRELLWRWIEFGAVSPVMRTKAGGIAAPSYARPQVWEDANVGTWRRYAKLHTQLNPYWQAADAEYRATGLPTVRSLALAYPGDAAGREREDEFLSGPDLLAAPVLEPGATERRLHLPPGAWIDWWRSVRERAADGGYDLRAPRLLRGGGPDVTLPAPLGELPLLVRAGAVLPLLSADVDSLADRYRAPGVVSAAQREDRRVLLAFPRGTTHGRMGADERVTSIERGRHWALRVRGSRRRTYALQATLGTLRRPFVPRRVTLDGRPLARTRWRYDRATRVLRVTFTARRGTLRVRPGSRPRRTRPRSATCC